MKAKELSISEVWNHIADKVMGAVGHSEMWAALSDIEGYRMSALQELDKREKLADCGPLLLFSGSAHRTAMVMELCSLYENPGKADCVTLALYRSLVGQVTRVPPELDERLHQAHTIARQLYVLRTHYIAHGLAITARENIWARVGLSLNQVLEVVKETKSIFIELSNIEGRQGFDFDTDRDVSVRISRTNDTLLQAINPHQSFK